MDNAVILYDQIYCEEYCAKQEFSRSFNMDNNVAGYVFEDALSKADEAKIISGFYGDIVNCYYCGKTIHIVTYDD